MRKHKGYGIVEIISGILMVVLGIMSFGKAEGTITTLVVLYAIMALINGISDIVFYARTERYVGFAPILSLTSGICSAMTGVMLLIYPHAGHVIISIMLPIWFIAHSIFNLANLPVVRRLEPYGAYLISLITNICGLVIGLLLVFKPNVSIVAVGTIIALYLIVMGCERVLAGISELRD